MAATAGHRLTLDPMGKGSNAFFSKRVTLQRTIQGSFLLSLVSIGPVVSEKKLEM
jgi:hypothetical protein